MNQQPRDRTLAQTAAWQRLWSILLAPNQASNEQSDDTEKADRGDDRDIAQEMV
jgi:hypothetical protein